MKTSIKPLARAAKQARTEDVQKEKKKIGKQQNVTPSANA